jgi:hypothetical protein
MANFKSNVIVIQEGADASAQAQPSNYVGKLPLFHTCTYTLLSTEVANDTIQLMDLPAECVLIPQLSSVTCSDPGTALTLDIGDAADPDRYAVGISLSNGGQVGFGSTTAVAAGITTPFLPAATSRVYATVKTATTLTPGTVLNFLVAFRIKG